MSTSIADRRHDHATIAGRVPPHDLDAEAAVLAAILLNREALDRVLEILKPEHFYSDANGKIFEAAMTLAAAGSPIDITTIAGWLRARERLAQVGGAVYLAQLADATPAVAHVEAHARTVLAKWRVRRLIATCQKIAAEGYGPIGDAGEFIAAAEEAVMLSTANEDDEEHTPTLGEAIIERVNEIMAGRAAAGGIGTGLDDVDHQLGPMLPCNFVVVGAHSGIGKTSLAMQIAVNVASTWAIDPETTKPSPASVLVCSMEMSRNELADRAALAALGIDTSKAARGMLTDDEKAKLDGLADRIHARRVLQPVRRRSTDAHAAADPSEGAADRDEGAEERRAAAARRRGLRPVVRRLRGRTQPREARARGVVRRRAAQGAGEGAADRGDWRGPAERGREDGGSPPTRRGLARVQVDPRARGQGDLDAQRERPRSPHGFARRGCRSARAPGDR